MKVILATPFFHQLRGNTITVRRIADGLNHSGVETEVISITEQEDHHHSLKDADLIHGFNAYRFYQFIKAISLPITNYTVTLTGTDLNHDLKNPNRKNDVIACLTNALAVHVFDEKAKRLVLNILPKLENKLYVIAQGTSTSRKRNVLEKTTPNTFHFLLPAGIRKVKNIPFAINSLLELRKTNANINLTIVGPIIEPDEGELVQQLVLENSDWVTYKGVIPHKDMEKLYSNADAVINTSHSEGQSSAILEAMSFGLPVLVSKNKGNLSLISNEETGFVYDGINQFLTYAIRLIDKASLREVLGENAAAYVEEHHSATQEISAMVKMYEKSLADLKKGGNDDD
ncbi:glycosyltransferase [Guptibacillus hwajinpoensis]|uniref:glycosyltransferase n=1 Tax=Guptibacillus hwajinpoensis TaxID=208199 RepID=UPI001CFEF09C|nr:glycosyltransferase [Pseudalkalibacillus hwajinpoensis]WLR61451.1 glycosyltransferase [Pseudalkalibacillus hwajinpoensis]